MFSSQTGITPLKGHLRTFHRGLPGGPVATNSQYGVADFDPESEAPILPPPDEKSRLTGKDPDAGKDGKPEEKGTTEDEMVGWHHRLN